MTNFFDSHAHLSAPQLLGREDEILANAKKAGVTHILDICTDEKTLLKGLEIAQKYPWVFLAAATTPHDVEKEGESFFPIVQKHLKALKAIGETGLDYHYEHSPKKTQQKFLIKYFELAMASSLPLIFHCRDAFPDLFSLSDTHYKGKAAVLHCFTGSLSDAKGCLDRGWFISFSGIVTFKKSQELRDVVAMTPLDRIFIETDSPYLAPQSKRGELNEPKNVVEVAEVVAQVKGVSLEEVARATSDNVRKFLLL